MFHLNLESFVSGSHVGAPRRATYMAAFKSQKRLSLRFSTETNGYDSRAPSNWNEYLSRDVHVMYAEGNYERS